ncbi:CAS/CSE protein C-terminus family protein [Babesia bovis T2Bo]|uniref:Uncharacterized protein n=1 Tax=Babesia bovis TaxID=5865 RepID=A7ATX3_BABBO|nr:CAS/CSE protein C-terminus family protein [Babesia bovis T2Bo]EDO06384.1 CAS/CSE protein C-terminus family protein [Babesia bovis T2Bo]|eukprot:XP_001609952.1 hypothetical protein [Babesia bovis T2Bo]
MADVGFTSTLVTLCRQSLSGNLSAIRSAEDNLKVLLQPNASELRLRLGSLFRIILVPSSLASQPGVLKDEDLKYVSSELQLWVSICLKNFVRNHFDTSESHGGVSEDIRRLVRCFVIVVVLNAELLQLDRNVTRQLEDTLEMLAEDDFPYNLDFAILFMSYCHLSDINTDAVTIAFSQRLHKAVSMRGNLNVDAAVVNISESLARSLEEAKSTVHLAYGETCWKLLSAYSGIQKSLEAYSSVASSGNLESFSMAYSELYRCLALGLDAMCDCLKGVALNDLDLSKFLQSAQVLFPNESVCKYICDQNSGGITPATDKGDALVYFDDRLLYKDDMFWRPYAASLPPMGGHGQCVTFSVKPGTVLNASVMDVTYFRRKAYILSVFKRLMKKYKTSIYSDGILRELKIILTISENMLLYVYKALLTKLRDYMPLLDGTNSILPGVVLDLMDGITCITKILMYIHAVDLPECCEDNVVVYIGSMIDLLLLSDARICQVDHQGVVLKMKIAICKLMRYYAERYQEVFRPFVFRCIDDMVTLCRGLGQGSEDDDLCSSILDFLTASASTHWAPYDGRTNPFTNAECLGDIIRAIVLPNIGFRDCDLFLIEDCALEFVQRELDTGNGHSRRFAAINFLKKLVNTYGQIVQHILNQFAQNVSCANDYKLKELYLQLIICSNFKANEGFDLHSYFTQHLKADLLRESRDLKQNQESILIVMAILKYIFTFKKHITVPELASLVMPIATFLQHPNDAVRFLAAETLNRIIPLVRENRTTLKPQLLQSLDRLLQLMRSEPPNEFYVRCVMRIFQFLREDVKESGFVMLDIIVELIKRACDNSVNPVYNHYLFECLALLIRLYVASGSTEALRRIEEGLIPTIAIIIQQEMHQFVPYGMQILYVLLRASQHPGPTYIQLFSHLTSIDTWKESTANAQGAAKLLTCYFERHTLFEKEISASMERILSIFHFCLTHRKLSLVSLDILNGILRYLPVRFYSQFLVSIITVLLTYIHNMKVSDCIPRVVVSMALLTSCLYLQQYSPGFIDMLESIQAGITQSFIQVVYLPNARKVLALESKRVLVLGTAIMLSSPAIQQSESFAMLVEFLSGLLQGQTLRVPQTPIDHDEEIMEDLDFDVSFVRLRSIDGNQDRGAGKLLDPACNVEQAVRAVLAPLGGILRQMPEGKSQILLNLLN